MVAGNLPPDGPAADSGYASTTAPTISITRSPASGARPLDVTFTPTPGGGTAEHFQWTWGDGTTTVGSGNPAVIHHIYNTIAGTFVAYCTVYNAGGTVTSATVSTTVT